MAHCCINVFKIVFNEFKQEALRDGILHVIFRQNKLVSANYHLLFLISPLFRLVLLLVKAFPKSRLLTWEISLV